MEGRKISRIRYSRKFLKSLGKLPQRIIEQAQEKEKIFKDNPFYYSLRTHKLSGKDKDCQTFWIDYSCRIKFIFLSNDEVLFLDIGTHEIYK